MGAGHSAGFGPPQFTAGEVFRRHGDAYRARHVVTPQQSTVLWCIAHCRTAAMGGHVDACDDCGWQQPAYNSCRNRHCPKCQGSAQAAWLAAREERLLPVPYFHVVMTLPSELRGLARSNPKAVYGLLMRSANETLLDLARDPKWMGGVPGITSVLHTWTRDLRLHPHVLPKGFVKIRHAGLYAVGNVNTRLVRDRGLVDEPAVDDADAIDLDAIIAELSVMPVAGCPTCGGRITCHPMPASGGGSTRAPPGGRTP